MRIGRCVICLRENDIREAIKEHLADASLTRVEVTSKSINLAGTIHFGTEWNIEVEVSLANYNETDIDLRVIVTNIPLIPALIKDNLIGQMIKRWDMPDIEYHNGLLHVSVRAFTRGFRGELILKEITFMEGAIAVTLDDIEIPLKSEEKELPVASTKELSQPIVVPDTSVEYGRHSDVLARLRSKTEKYAHQKLPKTLQSLVPWLLLVPDLFILLIRLMRDPRVPRRSKWIVGGALAYILSPINLIPNFIPILGEIDDLAVGLFALEQLLNEVPAEVVQENWSGNGDVVIWIREGTKYLNQVLSKGMVSKIRQLFMGAKDSKNPGI